jgi:hypothetical protein
MERETSIFIGQFQLGSQERAEVSLRKVNGMRMLVFTTVDSLRGEPSRGNGGLTVEVAQIPHLQTILMNAKVRALIDGPL